jgi:hypothetical protein
MPKEELSMKKYSKIYLVKGEKHFGYRYNYTDALLEKVSRYDFRKIDGEWQDVILEDWEVASAVGLSVGDWKDNPQYWIDFYANDIDEECRHIIATEFDEYSGDDQESE